MNHLAQLSIKSRLILMLLTVSLLTSIVIGLLGWRNGRISLNRAIENDLTSIRTSKAYQIESYFENIFSHTRTLSEDRMVVNAMREFREGYEVGVYRSLTEAQQVALNSYYDDEFLPRLGENINETPPTVLYRSRRPVANYFQYHYIVDNPYPVGQRDEMDSSPQDTTIYNRFHQFYHPIFRNLVAEFGYYDIFLIELETGNIVYSVYKEADYATSLREGPYRESGLGILAARVREEPERGKVTVVDFRPYDPSYAAPAAFVGAPIFDRNEAVGILAMQLPIDEINRVMTGDENWEANGLGQTGEAYLVGADQLLRSDSRLFLQDVDQYMTEMAEAGVSQLTLDEIERFDTTVLLQPISTEVTERAFAGESDTVVTNGYRNVPVLSSFSPVGIEGINWAIIAEIESAEAFAPVTSLQRNILIWSVGLMFLIAFAAVVLSQRFMQPIEKLTAGVKALASGQEDVQIDIAANDEFGDLARNFNAMVDSMRSQREIIEQKNAENERLLLNILPAPIAERLKAGERIADNLQQVSVVFIRIRGFAEMADRIGALQSAEFLETLINQLDEAAERHEVERVKTVGETYIAACGLTTARLDHAKRAVDFAMESIKIVHRFDHRHSEKLTMQIGVNSGPVITGVVGTHRFNYELWGETVNVANHIHLLAGQNEVVVTETVCKRVGAHVETNSHSAAFFGDKKIELFTIDVEPSLFIEPEGVMA